MDSTELNRIIKGAIGIHADEFANRVRGEIHEAIIKKSGSADEAKAASENAWKQVHEAIEKLIDSCD